MPATALDVRTLIAGQLEKMRAFYNVDLKHLTDELATQTVGGVSRSPLDFTQEVVGLNYFAAAVLRGEEPKKRTEEEITAFHASLNTVEKLKVALNESVDQLGAAIKACPEDQLEKVITAPWGAPISLQELAITCVQHMMYHDGQLNYFQAAKGDGEFHWMELMHG